jgi:hypothetical protein
MEELAKEQNLSFNNDANRIISLLFLLIGILASSQILIVNIIYQFFFSIIIACSIMGFYITVKGLEKKQNMKGKSNLR